MVKRDRVRFEKSLAIGSSKYSPSYSVPAVPRMHELIRLFNPTIKGLDGSKYCGRSCLRKSSGRDQQPVQIAGAKDAMDEGRYTRLNVVIDNR